MNTKEQMLKKARTIELVTFLADKGRTTGKKKVAEVKNENLAAAITADELLRRTKEEGLVYGTTGKNTSMSELEDDYAASLVTFAHSLLEEYVSIRSMAECGECLDPEAGVTPEALLEEAEDFYYAAQWILEYTALGGFLTKDASKDEAFRLLEKELGKKVE